MDWLFKASSPFKVFNLIASITFLAFLSACGSGGFDGPVDDGGPGTGGGNNPDPIVISLALTSASTGQTTQTITSANPGKVTATVSGISSPVIVTFSTNIASIPIPTAITNGSNQATVDILAGSQLGAGTITASVSTGEEAQLVYVVGATNLKMGSGSPFSEGLAQLGAAQISAGGTTTVSVTIVDENDVIFTEPVEVNFASACTNSNPATATLSTPITTVNGVASSTYLAQGCVGNDTINVTANAGGISLSANATVNVLSADVGSIEFVSASPENIVIQGAGGVGGSESSTVQFRVKDTNGNPVNGQVVNFSLNTAQGGISMEPTTATTNSLGIVQTVVNSGTVAATVRITATLDGSDPEIATQSSNLAVSTGIPDQDSFTLAASVLNPEAWREAGAQVEITAYLADGFNNPVPDGTAVSFSTEGGRIEPTCTTENGQCSVIWNSQNPRPTGATHENAGLGAHTWNGLYDLNDPTQLNPYSLGQPYGGRATIIATAIGEESFPDLNGNGRFDASEMDTFLNGKDVSGNDFDLDEAYRDHNEDGVFNPWEDPANEQDGGELEILVDFDGDNSWTQRDGLYNGVLCSIPAHAGCSSQKSVHVRSQIVLVMADNEPYIRVTYTGDTDPANSNPDDNIMYLLPETQAIGTFAISDLHNQPLPAGTKIGIQTTLGSVVGASEFTIPSTNWNGGVALSFTVKAGTDAGSGSVSAFIAYPSGLEITYPFIEVRVD
ncbi:Ig-like domain-containing protein [Aliikangiella sp. IMCC44632]